MKTNQKENTDYLEELAGSEILKKRVVIEHVINGRTVKEISSNYSISIGKTRNIINKYKYLLRKQNLDPEIERANKILYPINNQNVMKK